MLLLLTCSTSSIVGSEALSLLSSTSESASSLSLELSDVVDEGEYEEDSELEDDWDLPDPPLPSPHDAVAVFLVVLVCLPPDIASETILFDLIGLVLDEPLILRLRRFLVGDLVGGAEGGLLGCKEKDTDPSTDWIAAPPGCFRELRRVRGPITEMVLVM